ncbi:MAG: glycosyltransferase, partial [Planctomycetota bacterium JB042]
TLFRSWEIAHRYGWTKDDIDTFQGRSYGFKVALTRALQRWWWRRVDAIVCVSDYLRGIVAGHGIDPEKLHSIYNVYNGPSTYPTTREEARERLGVPADARLVVTVCRLMIWKGVDGLIETVARLPEDVRLVVVGDGDQLEPWSALARERGVQDRVSFVGNRPHDETLLWIRAADVFALNSRYEGLSHTLLEVMFLETPIVCTAVCGNPELVAHEENGLLVPFGDVDALGAALRRILTDRDLARTYAERSKEKVKRFDRDLQFTRLETLLGRLADGQAVRSRGIDPGCGPADPS